MGESGIEIGQTPEPLSGHAVGFRRTSTKRHSLWNSHTTR